MIDQRADERLDPLVRDDRHRHPPGVFQSGREEVDVLLGAVVITDGHLAEVVLRELARQSLEPHQRRHLTGPQRLGQGVDRGLAAGVAGQAGSVQQLHRAQGRLVPQRLPQDLPEGLRLRRSTNVPFGPLRLVIDGLDRGLVLDPPYRPHRHSGQGGHFRQRVAGPPEHLHLVTLEHVDHPFPRRRWSLQRLSKRRDQNLRNPQRLLALRRAHSARAISSSFCILRGGKSRRHTDHAPVRAAFHVVDPIP